jgi:type I restriction enzyme R subunit
MNEAETRAEHIDPALKAAGWGVVEGSRIRREYPITLGRIEGHGKRGKALTADYLLEYRNTKLTPLLKLKYRDSIPDAVADLGQTPLEIGQAFAGFQKYLYQQQMTV